MSTQLPHEVVLSIQRILELQDEASAGDTLDSLSSFDPTSTLNNLFPDGAFLWSGILSHSSTFGIRNVSDSN